jgi:hypothetical protein
LRRIYDRLQLEWPDDHDEVIKAYLVNKPRDKHGTHAYSLHDVGLDQKSVERSFEPYVSYYGISTERER